MYCVMRASAPSLYNVYRRYDMQYIGITQIMPNRYVCDIKPAHLICIHAVLGMVYVICVTEKCNYTRLVP